MDDPEYLARLEKAVSSRTEELRHAISNLERSHDFTVEGLGHAMSLKDAHTGQHCKRVTAFAICIAHAIGQSPDQIRVIARGAFLHDIGNLAIPSAILRKPAPLTADEMKTVRTHCVRGGDLVRKIPFLAEAAEVVYAHHEKVDGTGYPRGLKAEDIPIAARIVALADAFDAMTSATPYRTALSLQGARAEIERFSGSQFDPSLVQSFLQIPDQVWLGMRREIESGQEFQ